MTRHGKVGNGQSAGQKKGETRRLLYQYIGPFEVIGPAYKGKVDGDCNVYRLCYLVSDRIATYNVDLLFPYISVEAHVQLEEQKKTNQPAQGLNTLENKDFDRSLALSSCSPTLAT